MSSFFSNARDFSIDGGSFSIVHGDQNNYYRQRISQASEASTSSPPFANALGPITQATSSSTTTTTVQVHGNQINHIIHQREKVHTEFDDFRNVKRGDIYKIRNICQVLKPCEKHRWRWEECQCPREVIKTVCTAKLIGVDSEFTTVTYSGRDARKVFEEEFFKLSRKQFSEASQIFAIANGTMPSMVLWHSLIPLAQFIGTVGQLGLMYLGSLRRQLGCWAAELWIDSSRGVICHGPKGPSSFIPEGWFKFDLPPTAELLQEEVFLRFLGCQKSREADDAFMYVMSFTWNVEDVPERVDRPTIFSALTKTPIAVANNIWESEWDNLVERTCLENGWTRFRLDGDGWLRLSLNEDIDRAWLWQALSVFYARGVSLEDDLKDFYLVYPYGWLDGYLDDSPSKCQLRQRQPIYLFVYPPPPNLPNGETSPLHHWSFQEDGHSHISPESCFHLGLPVKLDYNNWGHLSRSWLTDRYKLIHQYQTARGFDPTTADFARHLGYRNIFQPFDDSDRFEDFHEDEITVCPNTPTTLGRSANAIDLVNPSNMRDQIQAEGMVFVGNPHDRGDECTQRSYHIVPNKRQKTNLECRGIETRDHPHQDLRHKVDLVNDEKVMMDAGLRPIRPLPARNLPFAGINPTHYVRQSTSVSQLHPLHHGYSDSQVPRSLSSRDVSFSYDPKASTASISNPFSLPAHTIEHPLNVSHTMPSNSFKTVPPSGSYIDSNDTHPVINPVINGINSPYSDPNAYSVSTTTTEYDADSVQDRLGWSDNSGHERAYRYNPPLNILNDNTFNHSLIYNPYLSTSPTPYLSHSIDHTQPPYFSHESMSPPVEYPSSSSFGGSLGSQYDWNGSTMQQPVASHSWVRPFSTPSYGRTEYGESSQRGGNSNGEGWF
ncbi:hypothetical protein PQX77_001848 [Marasmius sp. AFHP31]|nr:hypothetical protein PQX77_001848 [Marasmius sp. AFHP31]